MKELGAYLKRTRISNGVSITEACEDLEFSTAHLENIESGNVRAFKDVYELRDSIKLYAKYLGLDPDKIVDEFNGFLFQHTSKISLDDILEAQKKRQDSKKVKSPYTKEYKEKTNIWPVFVISLILFIVICVVFVVVTNINKKPVQVDELMGRRKELLYEFTN